MTKADLINIVAEKTNLSKRESKEILDLVFDKITEGLKKGEKVSIVGFGSFYIQNRKERKGVNPKTGASLFIPQKRVPVFKASKILKSLIKKP